MRKDTSSINAWVEEMAGKAKRAPANKPAAKKATAKAPAKKPSAKQSAPSKKAAAKPVSKPAAKKASAKKPAAKPAAAKNPVAFSTSKEGVRKNLGGAKAPKNLVIAKVTKSGKPPTKAAAKPASPKKVEKPAAKEPAAKKDKKDTPAVAKKEEPAAKAVEVKPESVAKTAEDVPSRAEVDAKTLSTADRIKHAKAAFEDVLLGLSIGGVVRKFSSQIKDEVGRLSADADSAHWYYTLLLRRSDTLRSFITSTISSDGAGGQDPRDNAVLERLMVLASPENFKILMRKEEAEDRNIRQAARFHLENFMQLERDGDKKALGEAIDEFFADDSIPDRVKSVVALSAAKSRGVPFSGSTYRAMTHKAVDTDGDTLIDKHAVWNPAAPLARSAKAETPEAEAKKPAKKRAAAKKATPAPAKKAAAKKKAEPAAKEPKEKRDHTKLKAFAATLDKKQAPRAQTALLAVVKPPAGVAGKQGGEPRHVLIERAVKAGKVHIVQSKGKPELRTDDGPVDTKIITQTGIKYAEWLLRNNGA